MPTGKKATNKTDFMRYVDAHPDSVPLLSPRLREYVNVHARRDGFGLWVRNKYFADFDRAYRLWWLKRSSLFGTVYDELSRIHE